MILRLHESYRLLLIVVQQCGQSHAEAPDAHSSIGALILLPTSEYTAPLYYIIIIVNATVLMIVIILF